MTVSHLLEQISSYEFAARVGVASDARTAESIAMGQPEAKALLDAARNSREDLSQVLRWTLQFARRPVDLRYESPWDVGLMTWLLILEQTSPDAARLAAAEVELAQNTFWAAGLARRLLTLAKPSTTHVSTKGIMPPLDSGDTVMMTRPAKSFFAHVSTLAVAATLSGSMTVEIGKPNLARSMDEAVTGDRYIEVRRPR